MKIKALILLCSIIAHSLFQLFVVGHYVCNYDRYAKVLCKNKDNPGLQCNGSCVFMEKMAVGNLEVKADDTLELPVQKAVIVVFLLFLVSDVEQLQKPLTLKIRHIYSALYESVSRGFFKPPFKPPSR